MKTCSVCGKKILFGKLGVSGECSACVGFEFVATIVSSENGSVRKIKPFSEKLWGGYVSPSGGFSNSARFAVHGINPKTRRQNKKVVSCQTSDMAQKEAVSAGLVPPFQCDPISFSAPTDAQRDYASKLQITFPSAFISVEDASALLSRAEAIDFLPTSPALVRYASSWGLHFSRYHGNEALLRMVRDYDEDCYQIVLKEDPVLPLYFEDEDC